MMNLRKGQLDDSIRNMLYENFVVIIPQRLSTAAKIATPHNPAIIYKPGDGVVSSGLAYVAVRACQAVVC